MRLLRRGIGALSILVVIGMITSALAISRQQEANEQRDIAVQQARVATARQLVAQAQVGFTSDPRTAASLTLAANLLYPGSETDAVLFDQLQRSNIDSTMTGHTGTVEALATSPVARIIATGSKHSAPARSVLIGALG
jgi:hypothetical protein